MFSSEKCCLILDIFVRAADTPETWRFSTLKLCAALGPSEKELTLKDYDKGKALKSARANVHLSGVTYFFSNNQAATMEDDKFGVFIDIQFDRNLPYNGEQAISLLIAKGNITRIRIRAARCSFLPLTLVVVRFGWMEILYLVGCANVGNLMLFHGNTCKNSHCAR